MNIKKLKDRSELGLVAALTKVIPHLNKMGRINSLIRSAEKKAIRRLDRTRSLNKAEMVIVRDKFKKFERLTRWDTRPRHLISYISAVLAILDGKGYNDIELSLVDVIDFFERHKKINPACFWSGDIVKKKWDKVWYEL